MALLLLVVNTSLGTRLGLDDVPGEHCTEADLAAVQDPSSAITFQGQQLSCTPLEAPVAAAQDGAQKC